MPIIKFSCRDSRNNDSSGSDCPEDKNYDYDDDYDVDDVKDVVADDDDVANDNEALKLLNENNAFQRHKVFLSNHHRRFYKKAEANFF